MYGSSGKHGRGGGGGGGSGGGRGGKRKPSPFPALASTTHHHRSTGGIPTNPSSSSSGRLSTGGGASRNRRATTTTPPPPPPCVPSTPDESFSLVSGDPLSYAMIVKLTPDLIDEIKRVEAQGGTPQIKFDSHAKNVDGNVIDVGGKDFQFTWSHELGDLCDIYEERQSGEDGNGLLVESGCPWRKLDVLRKLDESTKNHVKMRSEEAERKLKARRAIILDHANPAGKSPNTLPAVDVNPRRLPFMPKKEAPKRPKVETNQASVAIGAPPKSVPKSGSSSASTAKGRLSGSPLPSPPEQPVPSTSPILIGDLTRPPASLDAAQAVSKENTVNTEKETPTKTVRAVRREAVGNRKGIDITPKDMQSMLITLLLENPKGMSLKALEKAIVDTIPNCTKKIEPIIKQAVHQIATFQAPGRYFLKPGIELENLKKPSSESGSSPEYPHNQTPVQESNFIEKATVEESEPQTQFSSKQEELNLVEKIDIQQHSPDLLGDKKISDNIEGHAGSSSESGSDSESDSDSSDSGSDSGSPSRSKSRSAAGSGSSSDSDSDGSSSSKEGSDVDVDIMTGDDDKDETEQKLQTREVRLSASPIPWGTPDGGPLQNGIDEDKQDGRVSDAVEHAGVLPNDDEETDIIDIIDTVPEKASTRSLEEKMPLPLDRNQSEESQHIPFVRNVGNASQNTKNQFETSDRFEKMPKIKAKRGSDMNSFDEKTESAKRLKTGSLAQPQSSGRSKDTFSPENSNHLTPDRRDENPNKDPIVHMKNKVGSDGTLDMSKGYSSGRSVSDSQWAGQRSVDLNSQGKALDVERSSRYAENLGRGIDESERSLNVPDKSDGSGFRSIHAHDKFSMIKDKHKEAQGEDSYAYEKLQTKNVREGGIGDKQSMFSDSQFRRNGEQIGKLKDVRQMPHSHSHTGSFPLGSSKTDMDKSPHVNGKGKLLRRELSELELGELREPLPVEENLGFKKQFEKSNSFKMSKNKPNASDYLDPVLPKGRSVGKSIQESRKQSSPIKVGFANNQDGSFGKSTPEDDNEDSSMRPQQKPLLTQAPQIPRVDRIESEVGSQLNRSADIGSKARKNGTRTSQRIGLEDNGDTTKKAPVSLPQQHDIKHAGQIVVSNSVKETKPQKANPVTELSDRRIDGFCMESNNSGGRKRRESSSDEDDCSYNKYEKDEPELRGPIKDFLQYKEYVQEYCEKYGSYCSLNKNLETYRNKFSKLGNDLEHAKSRDVDKYYNILEQLKESYRQSGTKHRRLKKIFVVLHDELKHLKQRINDFAHPYIRD